MMTYPLRAETKKYIWNNKHDLNATRSMASHHTVGCQMTDVVVAEEGLENAGVMTWMRLCETGQGKLFKGRIGRLWGRP